MNHSKAAFRVLRETIGYCQADLASIFSVSVDEVRQWESPESSKMPPEDAWKRLEEDRSRQSDTVELRVDMIKISGVDCVVLPYFLSQEHYEKENGAGGFYGYENSIVRQIAAALGDSAEVMINYPGYDDAEDDASEGDASAN